MIHIDDERKRVNSVLETLDKLSDIIKRYKETTDKDQKFKIEAAEKLMLTIKEFSRERDRLLTNYTEVIKEISKVLDEYNKIVYSESDKKMTDEELSRNLKLIRNKVEAIEKDLNADAAEFDALLNTAALIVNDCENN